MVVLMYDQKQQAEMLLAWRKFVETVDPDILTGYNTINFDTWYILTRAQKLGLNEFPFLGRIKTQVKKKKSQSWPQGSIPMQDAHVLCTPSLCACLHQSARR